MMRSNELVAARPDMIWLKGRLGEDMQARLDFYIALSYVFEFYETDSGFARDRIRQIRSSRAHTRITSIACWQTTTWATLRRHSATTKRHSNITSPSITSRLRQDANRPKEVLYKIQMIYVATQNWEAGMPFFELGMRTLDNEVDRTTAAAYMMIGKARVVMSAICDKFWSFLIPHRRCSTRRVSTPH